MSDEVLKIQEVAALYKTTPGAIRAALWRFRHHGTDPGMPLPRLVRHRSVWLRSAVDAHLKSLATVPAAPEMTVDAATPVVRPGGSP